MLTPPIPILSNLLIFLRHILLSNKFHAIYLLYVNQTQDLVSYILSQTGHTGNHDWTLVNMNQEDSMEKWDSIEPQLLISVVDESEHFNYLSETIFLRQREPAFPNNLILSLHISDEFIYNHVLWHTDKYRAAVVRRNENDSIKLFEFNEFDPRKSLIPIYTAIGNTDGIDFLELLFPDNSANLFGQKLFGVVVPTPPDTVWITRNTKTLDARCNGMGGIDGYLSSLLEWYFNATLELMTLDIPKLTEFYNTSSFRNYLKDIVNACYVDSDLSRDAAISNWDVATIPHVIWDSRYRDFKPYPHGMDSYVAIVPNYMSASLQLLQDLNQWYLLIWLMIFLAVTTGRVILQKFGQSSYYRDFGQVIFDTIGLSFGSTGGIHIQHRPERILVLFFIIFTMFSGFLTSGFLFNHFSNVAYRPVINSIGELQRNQNLPIYMPSEFVNTIFHQDHASHQLSDDVYTMIYARNTSFAYILPERIADMLLGKLDADQNGRYPFHKIPEPIYSEYRSIRAPSKLLRNRLDVLIQRCVEHGIMLRFYRKTNRILKIDGRSNGFANSGIAAARSTSIEDLDFGFYLLCCGFSVGIAAFIAEVLMTLKCWPRMH